MTNLEYDLRRAKALLLQRGWLPSCGTDCGGPICTLNAAGDATYGIGGEEEMNRSDAIVQALCDAGGFDFAQDIAEWNDAQTSIESILALYDKAIATAAAVTPLF